MAVNRRFKSLPAGNSREEISTWVAGEVGHKAKLVSTSKIVAEVDKYFTENPELLIVCYGDETAEEQMVTGVALTIAALYWPIVRWIVIQIVKQLVYLYLSKKGYWSTEVNDAVVFASSRSA